MGYATSIAVAIVLSVATGFVAAQGQAPAAPAGPGGGRGRGGAGPAFDSANGHLDPGPAGNGDPDMNHPFHAGPLSPFDADGAAMVIHQNPDTYMTGTKGQGVGGGNAIACGVIMK